MLFGVGAHAQGSKQAATTVANNPASAFVYVPDTTVEGQVAVSFRSVVE